MEKVVHVAVAVIRDSAGKILLSKRADHVHQGGLWEFPGGKVEPGETVQQSLSRELFEELGIIPQTLQRLISLQHDYGDKKVALHVWEVTQFAGEPSGLEGQPITWVRPNQLSCRPDAESEFPLPAANLNIVRAIQLPNKIAITGSYSSEEEFLDRCQSLSNSTIDWVLIRKQIGSPPLSVETVQQAASYGNENGFNLVVSSALEQFLHCANGIHLTSSDLMTTENKDEWLRRMANNHQSWLGASCHSAEELLKADALNLDYAFLSPIKITATHPKANPLGWEQFSALVERVNIPVFALGGMSENDIHIARENGGQGIAAISAFWEKFKKR